MTEATAMPDLPQLAALVTELDQLIRARYPLIALETPEEERALALVQAVAALPRQRDKPVFLWSAARGLRRLAPGAGEQPLAGADGPTDILAHVDGAGAGLFVLADFAAHLTPYGQEEPLLVRQLRELAFALKGRRGGPTVLLVGVAWPALAS